jgi:hypothetical protein
MNDLRSPSYNGRSYIICIASKNLGNPALIYVINEHVFSLQMNLNLVI